MQQLLNSSVIKQIRLIMKRLAQITALIVIISFLTYSCFNRSAVKTFNKNVLKKPYDAIIVPGFPYEDSTWHDVMMIRVYWSHYLYKNNVTKNVIYSGSAVYSPYVESKIMAEYGKALGIPEEHIFTDTVAEHSTENVYYSYKLARNLGFEKIALATDPFQTTMLKGFVKRKKLDIDYLPIVFDTLSEMEKPEPQIDPSVAYVEDFESLPDREGFFKRLGGTMGKNIDHDVYEQ